MNEFVAGCDCLLVDGEKVTPVEIKSGKTMSSSYFDNLQYWRQLAALPEDVLRPALTFPAFCPLLEQAARADAGLRSLLNKIL